MSIPTKFISDDLTHNSNWSNHIKGGNDFYISGPWPKRQF